MRRCLSEYGTFFRVVRESFSTTGAIAPSSRFLARAIAAELSNRNGPIRVLEVGAGTGALTREIVRFIGDKDQLDIVELNGHFVKLLRRRFEQDPKFSQVACRTRILHMAVQDLVGQDPYDYIISGLPLNNFPVQLVREVLRGFHRLLATGGVLSFFEYFRWIKDAKGLVSPSRERRRLSQVSRVLDRYLDRYEFRRNIILINLPPAVVYHLRFQKAERLQDVH